MAANLSTVIPGSVFTSFQLTSNVTGAAVPFTVGHPLAQGSIPAGSGIVVSGANAQATIKNTWPDGSAKFAIIAGTASLSAGAPSTISLASGSSSSGTALTTADLKAALTQPVTIGAGAYGSASWSGTDWDAPFQTWVTGHRMSSWVYRKQIGTDAHLVGWLEVRLYAGGLVEVLPWIENCYTMVAGPTSKSDTWSFTMGGTQRFSQAFAIADHTRIPLLTGSTFSYWLGTAYSVTPKHDTPYLLSTKMVQNYAWRSPSASTLNGLLQTYAPNTLAGWNPDMGAGGGSAGVLPLSQILYCVTGDQRAYSAALVWGFSGGSWSTHYRDESFGNLPVIFTNRPNLSLQADTSSPVLPTPTGTQNGTATNTHQHSFGYLPYLITGRWWFLEEQQFWSTYNFLIPNPDQRKGLGYQQAFPPYKPTSDAGIFDSTNGACTVRGAAWSLRTLSQSLAITPTSHPAYSALLASWEANVGFYYDLYVSGAYQQDATSALYVNSPLGYTGEYGNTYNGSSYPPNKWNAANWQQGMWRQVMSAAYDMSLSTNFASKHQSLMLLAGRLPTGLAGIPGSGWDYRWFGVYATPIGRVDTTPWSLYTDFLTPFNVVVSFAGLTTTGNKDTALRQHEQDLFLGPNTDSSWPYFGQQHGALACAVDAGVPGANAAWNRVISAQNYLSVAAAFNDEPTYGGIVPRPQTYIASLAAKLSPGQCIRMVTPLLGGFLTLDGSDFIQWAESMYDDPVRGEIGFIGKRDGPNRYWWLVYNRATNTWSNNRNPWSTGTFSGHGYDHNTCDKVRGDVYHVPYGSNQPWKYAGSTNTWSQLPGWGLNTGATGGLTFFPGLGLLYNDGVGITLWDGTAWTTQPWSGANGSSYHDFSEYNRVADVLLFGGGNSSGIYTMSRGKSFAQKANPPSGFVVGSSPFPPGQGPICSDPNSARFVAYGNNSGLWYEYNLNTNLWTPLTKSVGNGASPQNGVPPFIGDQNNSTICVALDDLGCQLWIQYQGDANPLQVWLYRHT